MACFYINTVCSEFQQFEPSSTGSGSGSETRMKYIHCANILLWMCVCKISGI